MKKLTKIGSLLVFFYGLLPYASYGQEEGDFARNVDPPPTPIDDFLYYFMVITIVGVGVYFFRKNNKLETK